MADSDEVSEGKRAESRASILGAAQRLLARRGYHSCRVADIAREAGMSTGNVYWHFASKEALLREILLEGFRVQDRFLHEIWERAIPAAEKTEMLLNEYTDYYCEHHDFVVLALSLLAHDGLAFFHQMGVDAPMIGARYHPDLTAILVAGRDAGVLSDLPPHTLCMLLFSFLNGQAVTYGPDGFSQRRDVILSALHRLLWNADCQPDHVSLTSA